MESKKINQLATELTPALDDLTIIGDPTTGVSKKITLSQMASLFTGTVEEYASLAAFPLVGVADTIYIALDTNVLYRWDTGLTSYVELSPNIINSLVFNDANGFDGTIALVGSVATLTITTALTTGSVGFIGASGALIQDNANFFWDDSNNRLGIGTNAPTTAIDVFGSGIIGRLNGTSTNNAYLGFASAGSNKWSIGNVQSDHRFRIYNEATTSELVSVLQTGEFGIGIANPTTKLHIDGGASALIANLDANVSVAKSLSFRSDNSNRINLEVSGTESGSNAGMDLFFRTYTDAGALLATPLTIKRSTGNIGINTNSPFGMLSFGTPIGITSFPTYSTVDQATIGWNYWAQSSDLFTRYLDIVAKGSPDGTNGASIIRFLVNPITNASNPVEKLRITSLGAITPENILIQNTAATKKGYTFNSPASGWGAQTSGLYFTPNNAIDAKTTFTLELWNGVGNIITPLTIADTGIATFSNSIIIQGNGSTIRSGNELRFNRADNGIYTRMYDAGSGFSNGFIFDNTNGEGFHFKNTTTSIMRMPSTNNVIIGGVSDFGQKFQSSGLFNLYSAYSSLQNSTKTASSGSNTSFVMGTDYGQGAITDNVGGLVVINISEANTNISLGNAIYIGSVINPRGSGGAVNQIQKITGGGVSALSVSMSGNTILVNATMTDGGNYRATLTFIGGAGTS
jgi:hypothetical protein